jgi:2-isopropylmalate synthase
MERTIKFCDVTLRDGEQTPGVHFAAAQKLDIAKRLRRMGIDVIEAGFPASSPGDFDAVSGIAGEMADCDTCTVSALARMTTADIDTALRAIEPAKRKRLHVFIATRDIHLENKLHMTREQVLARISQCITYAKSKNIADEIEFSAEDATRTDLGFLCQAVECAVAAGASVINIPDTVGYTTPDEFTDILRAIRQAVKGHYELSVHCHNDLGLAAANSIAAVQAGATQIECTINGLGERAGNAPFEEIVMALTVRNDVIGVFHHINTREITETSRLVASLSGIRIAPNKAVVGANAFSHASGIHQHGIMNSRATYEIMDPASIGLRTADTIVLGKLSGRHAFAERVKAMGYSLTAEGIDAAFTRFKEIADKKSVITDEDLRAIVGEYLDSLEGRYYLSTFQIQSGNHIKAMALVTLKVTVDDNEPYEVTEAAPGEGPIDAAFNAIERIAGAEDTELISYNITAVTEGTDALGEARVRLKSLADGSVYTGRGVSTDVIKASIKAYLNAVNKWTNANKK